MSSSIGVPEALAEKVAEFVRTAGLGCEVLTGEGGVIQVVEAAEGEQSTASTLRSGGWIACEDAFKVATQLEIPTQVTGKLMNVLDIRIRNCQLGCF